MELIDAIYIKMDWSYIWANIESELVEYQNQECILVRFNHNPELDDWVRSELYGARWVYQLNAWRVNDTELNRQKLNLPIKIIGSRVLHRIHTVNRDEMHRYIETLQLKGYSKNTMRTYVSELAQWFYALGNQPATEVTEDQLRAYLLHCMNQLQLSENQIHSRLNALKFYYEQLLQKNAFFLEIPRPKKPKNTPKVLAKSEIRRMFEKTSNIKHRVILKMVYGLGLRVSEVTHLRISSIDSKRMMVHLVAAKGKKDRYVPLPHSLLEELREYYLQYRPKYYLFEGFHEKPIALRTVQTIFKQACYRAKIRTDIGIHSLRHSYATHLLEAGTDMAFIQKLLGHQDMKTTLVYAKVSNTFISKVVSPLDSFEFD